MNALPAEILLEIGKIDVKTYRSMLNIPRFARAVTIGYRLDIMKSGYDYKKVINIHDNIWEFDYIYTSIRTNHNMILTRFICKSQERIASYIIINVNYHDSLSQNNTGYDSSRAGGTGQGNNYYFNDGYIQCTNGTVSHHGDASVLRPTPKQI